jgi:hypothetical protein
MSDMTMNTPRTDGAHPGDAKATATLAIFLWAVVIAGLAYGLINTFRTVVDLFSG